jgi:hypothetical protein
MNCNFNFPVSGCHRGCAHGGYDSKTKCSVRHYIFPRSIGVPGSPPGVENVPFAPDGESSCFLDKMHRLDADMTLSKTLRIACIIHIPVQL